jgi:hypothetical protein
VWVPGSKIPQEVMRRAAPTLSFIFSHTHLAFLLYHALSGNLGFRHSLMLKFQIYLFGHQCHHIVNNQGFLMENVSILFFHHIAFYSFGKKIHKFTVKVKIISFLKYRQNYQQKKTNMSIFVALISK